ncbi:MAG: hypothetical protein CMF74_15470 [Maricaulis sp.]|jgi:uncharacterized protein (TIGR02466 family)|nr:hypothetical protein [Maricaulis sp.]|tara:strand:+ start:397 stop:1053 length:657 start_codon:yes stop_codon:yes gene_type:complete
MKENLHVKYWFDTPIYISQISEWIKPLNKICNGYIKETKILNKDTIKKRDKAYKKKLGDLGMSHHSKGLLFDNNFNEFQKYVKERSIEVLDDMGYDLRNYNVALNELWVQEFAKNGGGHHEGHVHYNSHLSGFYFLKCSDKTSYPIFHDPRVRKSMCDLPLKDKNKNSVANSSCYYLPNPGNFIIFPAYLEHQFVIDYGVEPFRFIHFNVQALPKFIK